MKKILFFALLSIISLSGKAQTNISAEQVEQMLWNKTPANKIYYSMKNYFGENNLWNKIFVGKNKKVKLITEDTIYKIFIFEVNGDYYVASYGNGSQDCIAQLVAENRIKHWVASKYGTPEIKKFATGKERVVTPTGEVLLYNSIPDETTIKTNGECISFSKYQLSSIIVGLQLCNNKKMLN